MKIAIQGGPASFHDIAAHNYFGKNIETIQCDSFRILCTILQNSEVDYAVMAIENSIAGSILSNYSLMQDFNFFIIGEIQLRIEQNLMVYPGIKLPEIKKIRSHYMALLQCREFISNHPKIEVEEFYDTAESARLIRQNKETEIAAIAGRYAAELYNLDIIASGIETEKMNYTRFMILSRNRKKKIEGANKATISFQLPNKVGALADVLRLVVENNINLTKIQSVPIVGKPNQYTFYVDCEWQGENDFKNAIEINSMVLNLKILGEYKKGAMIHDYTKS